jgi:hypothetical protein
MDEITPVSAMRMLPVWMIAVLRDLWRESAPIAIAGGFPVYCLGYTCEYGDIDIFMHKNIFSTFIAR